MNSSDLNAFDRLIDIISKTGASHSFRSALVDVCDTAYACKLWFQSYGFEPTAADLVAMTRLIMEREAAITTETRRAEQGE